MNHNQLFAAPAVVGRKRERWFGLGLFSGLAPMAAPGGFFATATAKGLVVCLALSATGGAWLGGRQLKSRDDARRKVVREIQRSWQFARAKDAELLDAARSSALSEMNLAGSSFKAEAGNPAAGSDSLAMALRANQGMLRDPDAAEAAKQEAADSKEKKDENADPTGIGNLLPDISELTKNAKDGKLPDLGIGKLRDSLSGAGGAGKAFSGLGMSGGIRQKFADNGGLRNKTLAKAKLKADALSRIAEADKMTQRGKTAASNHGLSLSGDNFKRLAKMNKAMGPTKKADNLAGAAQTHTDEWSSAQSLGGAGVTGAGARTIGGAGGGGAGGSGLGTAANGGVASGPNTQTVGPDVDPVGKSDNKTPYQPLVIAAIATIAASAACLVTAAILKSSVFGDLAGAAKVMAAIALALAGVAILLGAAIGAMDQLMQGGVFMVMGGILAVLAYMLL